MDYFFQLFFRERPKLKIYTRFTAHSQICTVWGTETYFCELIFKFLLCSGAEDHARAELHTYRNGIYIYTTMRLNFFGRPAQFQTSNFIGPYNLHRLLLSGLGLLFRSLPIVLLDQS